MLYINDDLNVVFRKGMRVLDRKEGRRLAMGGEILGYTDGFTTLDRDGAEKKLVDAFAAGEDLVEIVRWTVGSYFLLVNTPDQVTLMASPASPGVNLVYRTDSILVTTDDAEMARHASCGGINEMEVLRYLFTKPAPSCPPLTTLFEKARRLPGGAVATVRQGFDTSVRFYIHEAPELAPASYERFKRIFEDCARLSCQGAEDRQLFATVSGGIDSSVTLLAALAAGYKPVPLHWRKNTQLSGAVALFCRKLGLETKFLGRNYFLPDPLKVDWDRAEMFYTSALGVMNFSQLLTALAGSDGAYLTGMAFGNILQVNAQMRVNFGEDLRQRKLLDSKLKKPLRHLFTPSFWECVRRGGGQARLERIARLTGVKLGKAPENLEQYLVFLAVTNEFPFLPGNFASLMPQELEDAFFAYLRRTNYEDVLGAEIVDEVRGTELSDSRLLRLARLLRFAHQVQRTTKNDSEYAKFGGFKMLSVPMEGPILSYCMSRPVTREDVLEPKRDLFTYFRERMGFSYSEFLDMDNVRRQEEAGKDYGGSALPGEEFRKNEEILYDTPDFKENYSKYVNPGSSALLQMLPSGQVRDSLREVYKRNAVRPEQYMLGNQLLNLELFLRVNA